MNLDELYKARYVLNSIIRRTDLVQAPRLNPEADIYLKPENLQVTRKIIGHEEEQINYFIFTNKEKKSFQALLSK